MLAHYWRLATFLIPKLRQTRFQRIFKRKQQKERRGLKSTYILFRWQQSMYSQPYANQKKSVTFLIPEVQEKHNRRKGWIECHQSVNCTENWKHSHSEVAAKVVFHKSRSTMGKEKNKSAKVCAGF